MNIPNLAYVYTVAPHSRRYKHAHDIENNTEPKEKQKK